MNHSGYTANATFVLQQEKVLLLHHCNSEKKLAIAAGLSYIHAALAEDPA
jgi:hypothetical protein